MWYIKIKTSNSPCWYNQQIDGDPGRTIIKENATRFCTQQQCEDKIKRLEELYPNRQFEIDSI